MKISFSRPTLPETGVLVVTALEGAKLSDSAKQLDGRMKGGLTLSVPYLQFSYQSAWRWRQPPPPPPGRPWGEQ